MNLPKAPEGHFWRVYSDGSSIVTELRKKGTKLWPFSSLVQRYRSFSIIDNSAEATAYAAARIILDEWIFRHDVIEPLRHGIDTEGS